jgi:hypothetical protein
MQLLVGMEKVGALKLDAILNMIESGGYIMMASCEL